MTFRIFPAAALTLTLAAGIALAATGPAAAQGQTVEVPAPTGNADLTVYNNNFAMVRERRTFRMPASSARLVLGGVPREMQAETAFLQVMKGDAVRVNEQIFSFDVLTPSKLLERAVGAEVSVITVNPGNGREVTERARVLSVAEGLVLEIDGKIHTNHPGRIVFDSAPAGARARPALAMAVTGKAGQDVDAELSYLTGGFSWRPDYVAQYDADANRMDLLAWATVTNATDTGFTGARIKLIAGDVNRNAPRPQLMRAMKAESADMAMAAAPASFGSGMTLAAGLSTYVYTVAGLTGLGPHETKQLGLLNAQGISVRRQYTARAEPHYFGQVMRGQMLDSRASVELAFTNDKAAKLGVPLPAGIVRVYGQDAEGAPQFLGEDNIGHTAVGGDVTLALGQDFDIPVVREQLNFVRATDSTTLTNWRVTVSNAKARPVSVRVIEPIPGSWEISKESHPHTKLDAGSALWTLDVPAKGKVVLEYNARITY